MGTQSGKDNVKGTFDSSPDSGDTGIRKHNVKRTFGSCTAQTGTLLNQVSADTFIILTASE